MFSGVKVRLFLLRAALVTCQTFPHTANCVFSPSVKTSVNTWLSPSAHLMPFYFSSSHCHYHGLLEVASHSITTHRAPGHSLCRISIILFCHNHSHLKTFIIYLLTFFSLFLLVLNFFHSSHVAEFFLLYCSF